MEQNCIFCKIIQGKIPSSKVYEDQIIFAFNDINPQSPVHILLVPKKHIASLNDLSAADGQLVSHLILTAARLAKEKGLSEAGYRLVFNCGRDGGQSVEHIHGHLLGGRALHWPPG